MLYQSSLASRISHPAWAVLRLLCALTVVAAGVALAQEATGRVIGVITDPAGAVVPQAKVTVINSATQQSRATSTDENGTFQVLNLPIGPYRVIAEKEGFNKIETSASNLEINQSLRFDVTLTVGATTQTVQIESQATNVETVNATLGQTVTERPIIDLPLNGRNVLDLMGLQPGVTPNNPNTGGAGGYSINGGRADSVTYLIDGGINNNLLDNGVVFNPNPDAVQEFRILSSNYTAEYGRNGSGIVNLVTKSGTSTIHGSLFEYLRNEDFNANTFFNNANGVARAPLKRNQYGGTIGGPIVIPKIIHGKDKFFWFFGFQGQRQVSTSTGSAVTVFTPAELGGDFSRSAANGGPDPGVVSFLQKNPFFQPNAALAAQGIIDPTRIDPVAKKYISSNLIATSPTGRIFPQGGATSNINEFNQKYDFNITQNDRLSFTLGSKRNPSLSPFGFNGSNVPGFPYTSTSNNYVGNVSYVKVITPSIINDARITVNRNNTQQAIPGTTAPNASQLGVGITPDDPTGPPLLSFQSGLLVGFSPQGPTKLINNTYSYSDTFTWVKGRHNLKFGGAYSAYQNNTFYDFYVNGEFFFSGNGGGIGSNNDRADFLLGLPDEYSQFGAAPSNVRSKYGSWFAQDEWHATPNLTLTFGLRYDYSSPKLDTAGRSFSLAYGQQSTVFPNAPKGLLFPGDANAPVGANFGDKNDFAPRFGFAYSPGRSGRTSIRGGFGVFYDILKAEDNLQYNGQAPFFGFADLVFDPLSANPTRSVNYLSDPFGATGSPNSFPSRPPAKNLDFDAAGFLPFGGSGVYFVDPHLRTPYIYQYNLSVQRELVNSLTMELDYVGSSSHKLTALVDTNPFILGTTTRRYNAQPGLATYSISPFSYLDTFTNAAHANYNALEVSLRKRFTQSERFGNSQFQLSYTWSHNIDNASGFRSINSRVPYYNENQFTGNSDLDLRHRLVFSGLYDIPLSHYIPGPKALLGGWGLYPIVTWQTGFPLDIKAGLSRTRTSAGPSGAGDPNLVRVNYLGSGSPTIFDPEVVQVQKGRTGNFYFDPNQFSTTGLSTINGVTNVAARTYGTLPRNAFFGPGRTNVDLTLAKAFPIKGERVQGQFRVDAFNLFNHTQFQNPSTSPTSLSFGQVTNTYAPRILQLVLRITF